MGDTRQTKEEAPGIDDALVVDPDDHSLKEPIKPRKRVSPEIVYTTNTHGEDEDDEDEELIDPVSGLWRHMPIPEGEGEKHKAPVGRRTSPGTKDPEKPAPIISRRTSPRRPG